MSRLLLSIALLVADSPQVECAPPCPDALAAFAWASAKPVPDNAAAALAWAAAKCPCGPDCPCVDCRCNANPRGLVWRLAPKDDVNAGKVLYLIEPGKCNGQTCTPDKIIGGITIGDGDYQQFDGRKWGKSCKPPIAPPTAAILHSLPR